MKDPYLQEIDAYLNSLNRFSAPVRTNPSIFDKSSRFGMPLRAMAILGVVFAAMAFIPWSV